MIRYVRANRDQYGQVDIVYGARSKEDLVDYPEIVEQWRREEDLGVHLTIDRGGRVGTAMWALCPAMSGSWALIRGKPRWSAALL